MNNNNTSTFGDLWGTDAYDRATDLYSIVERSSEMFESRIYIEPVEPDINPITFGQLGKFVLDYDGVCIEANDE